MMVEEIVFTIEKSIGATGVITSVVSYRTTADKLYIDIRPPLDADDRILLVDHINKHGSSGGKMGRGGVSIDMDGVTIAVSLNEPKYASFIDLGLIYRTATIPVGYDDSGDLIGIDATNTLVVTESSIYINSITVAITATQRPSVTNIIVADFNNILDVSNMDRHMLAVCRSQASLLNVMSYIRTKGRKLKARPAVVCVVSGPVDDLDLASMMLEMREHGVSFIWHVDPYETSPDTVKTIALGNITRRIGSPACKLAQYGIANEQDEHYVLQVDKETRLMFTPYTVYERIVDSVAVGETV